MNLVKEVVSDAAEFGKEMLGGGKSNKFVPPSPAEKGSNDEEEDVMYYIISNSKCIISIYRLRCQVETTGFRSIS